jgi:hypothetical protein
MHRRIEPAEDLTLRVSGDKSAGRVLANLQSGLTRGGRPASHLLQLDQGPAKIFRVEEQDGFAVGTDFGRAVAEHAGAVGF